MSRVLAGAGAAALLAIAACGSKQDPAESANAAGSAPEAGSAPAAVRAAGSAPTGGAAGSAAAGAAAAGSPPLPGGALRIEGFRTPRAVLHDAEADVYLVSNVNGDPAAADDDDNGFISRVSPSGKLLELRWIDGARDEDLQLSAPMGMALAGGVLWVVDCNRVHAFDAKTGKLRKTHKLGPDASLADVAIVDGAPVVSDEGPELGPGMLYRIAARGRPAPYLRPNQRDVGRPHGLYAAGDGSIWVTADRELYRVVRGERVAHAELPDGPLDGVVGLPGGELLVASHEGIIYRGRPAPDGRGPLAVAWTAAITGLLPPSDLGLDAGRRRLLIPLVLANAVEIRDLAPP